jgi:hypothetical protein
LHKIQFEEIIFSFEQFLSEACRENVNPLAITMAASCWVITMTAGMRTVQSEKVGNLEKVRNLVFCNAFPLPQIGSKTLEILLE